MLEIKDAITDPAELDRMYPQPAPPSMRKVVPRLTEGYRRMIEASPFVAVATCGGGGLDCSPRGDIAGFVRVADEQTILLPERRGNNRIDTLRNLVADPRIALLFLIPGVGETLRVNGSAEISTAPGLLERFPAQGKLPRSVIVVHVGRVYFQCPKALVRSDLWNPSKHLERRRLSSTGTILADITRGRVGGPGGRPRCEPRR